MNLIYWMNELINLRKNELEHTRARTISYTHCVSLSYFKMEGTQEEFLHLETFLIFDKKSNKLNFKMTIQRDYSQLLAFLLPFSLFFTKEELNYKFRTLRSVIIRFKNIWTSFYPESNRIKFGVQKNLNKNKKVLRFFKVFLNNQPVGKFFFADSYGITYDWNLNIQTV